MYLNKIQVELQGKMEEIKMSFEITDTDNDGGAHIDIRLDLSSPKLLVMDNQTLFADAVNIYVRILCIPADLYTLAMDEAIRGRHFASVCAIITMKDFSIELNYVNQKIGVLKNYNHNKWEIKFYSISPNGASKHFGLET